MEVQVKKDGFFKAVTLAALCHLFWQLSSILGSILAAPMWGGSAGAAFTAVATLLSYVITLALVLPLFLLSSGISLRTVWSCGGLDVGRLKGYFPVVYAANLAGAFMVMAYTVFYTYVTGGAPGSANTAYLDFGGPVWATVALILVTGVVGPLMEEVLFRGLMLSVLKPYGKGFAVLATALIFGLAHGSAMQLGQTFLVGVVLACVTLETGSIKTAFLLHAAFNSTSVVLVLVQNLSETAGSILGLALTFGLGGVGVFLVLKYGEGVRQRLLAPSEDFIFAPHRLRRFLLNPVMLLVLLLLVASLILFSLPLG